jgi:hypothetical protein
MIPAIDLPITLNKDCQRVIFSGPHPSKDDLVKVSCYVEGNDIGSFVRFQFEEEALLYMLTAAVCLPVYFAKVKPYAIDEVTNIAWDAYECHLAHLPMPGHYVTA